MGKTLLCLDEMPFGTFLEIEGEKKDIVNIAETLGLKWEKRILATYLALFSGIKTQLHLSFSDITFEHFAGLDADMSAVIREFEAGAG
jgi:adenylate cyclase class 2